MKLSWLVVACVMAIPWTACAQTTDEPAVTDPKPAVEVPLVERAIHRPAAEPPAAEPPDKPAPAWDIANAEFKGLAAEIVDEHHRGMAPLYRALTAVKRTGATARVASLGHP